MNQTETVHPPAVERSAPRPLTILHVDSERAWGGGQAQLIELCRYLAGRGHRQVVACPADAQLRALLPSGGITVRDLRIRNDLDLIGAWQLRRVLAADDFDIVHFHTARAHSLTPFLRRRRGGEQPCRFVVTRLMDYPPHFKPRVRYLYNHCVDGVIAISHAIADVLVAVGVDPGHVRVIHLGIDCSPFQDDPVERAAVRKAWGVASTDLVVFTAAMLSPRKGHDVLLEALVQLAAEGLPVRWVICGDGALRSQLEARVTQRGMAQRVIFTGFSSEVPRLIAGADVFVLPSRHEGLGIAVMEAMAAGLPAIASRVGGLPEIVVEGETGLLVPPGDAMALATALRRLAGDPVWARTLGRQGRTRAFQLFSSTSMAAAVEQYYEELLRQRV